MQLDINVYYYIIQNLLYKCEYPCNVFIHIKINYNDKIKVWYIKSCNVADFYHVTFAFRRVDFYYEIPSIRS